MSKRWLFLIFLCGGYLAGWAQCPSLPRMQELLFREGSYVSDAADSIRAVCPTAADSLAAVFYNRSAYHYGQGDLAAAIEMGQLALAEFRISQPPGREGLMLGRIHYNLGLFHQNRGEFRRARTYFREASRIFPLVDHPEKTKRWLRALLDLGYSNAQLGDFDRARAALELVRNRATAEEFPFYAADAKRLLGEQLLEQGELGAAAGAMEVALAELRALGEDRWAYATAINLGNIYYKQGRYGAARRAIAPALDVQDLLPLQDLARMQSLLALLALRAGDAPAAERWFEENRSIALETGDPQFIAQAYDNGAEVALAREDYPEAIRRVGEAIAQLVPGYRMSEERLVPDRGQLAASPHKIDLFVYLGDLARMLELAGRPEDAIAVLFAADGLTDELRAGLAGTLSQLFWRKRALPIYERAIRLSHAGGQAADAFHFFEKSRAILLLEALAEADAISQLPEAATARLSKATSMLLEQQRKQLLAGPDKRPALAPAVAAARDSLVALRAELAGRYPGIFAAGEGPDIIDEPAAREQLRALGYDRQLAYFLGEAEAFLLVTDASGSRTVSLGPTDSLEAAVGELLGYFTKASRIDGEAGGYLRLAHLAFQRLLAPAGSAPHERLLILPDGLLAYLPFAALVTEARAVDLAMAPYLLQRNPLAYAQSATVLRRQMTASKPQDGTAYLFAPFTDAPADSEVKPLRFSVLEVDALAGHYPNVRRQNTAAKRAALLAEMPAHELIHLSTHAYAARDGSAVPRILTADSAVFVPDVYGLRLRAELVTLSACQSNIGPLAEGEGVLGLGRAFTAAGARGVVASLWALNDRATADIITTLYEELAAGTPKPLALHRAQLAYLERTDLPAYLKSPYYWAGLTYYGDAGTLPAGSFPWWLLAPTLLLLGGWLFWWRRAR